MTELRPRGRPRSTGTCECGRCGHLVPRIRVHWPDGAVCGACFTAAVRTYGTCVFCGEHRLLPGRSAAGALLCRDCAGITTTLTCDRCGREAERLRGGHCARCVLTADLEHILRPSSPADLRIKRLITILAAVPRPESVLTWMRNPTTADLLARIGTRELQLSHPAFDALPPSRSVEHLREMLVHHHMLPSRGDPRLARFEIWLDHRLTTLQSTPEIHTPIEQFARWHHLRRLRELDPRRSMDNAARTARQEITEATKFLTWLRSEHHISIAQLRQAHLDAYLSDGTTTRHAIRNFIQWRHRTGIAARFTIRYRTARSTPLVSSARRLELIRISIEADHITLSTRIAALLLLLYGIPVRRIAELTRDDLDITPTGPTVRIGTLPAPLPEPLLPLVQQYLDSHANQQTTNHNSHWLFPGTRAGHHLTEQSLMKRLRLLGIDIRALRNTALHELSKEIDAASLAALLGYTPDTMNIHATRAGTPMGSYPTTKHPTR
ncbi:recombinase XerD [Rhodococcus sp. DMU2021]|uniref:recombinase XerD n=1 Tax=Rhodococcus sp. DMU2021 TaxID=2866997 RepID=UPI001C7CEE95|nr:recombinase XerD [Rhodococcus sp. DMU2021]MBX4171782.1 recombinase XerD [Rhodococcus sp. DMU2021]